MKRLLFAFAIILLATGCDQTVNKTDKASAKDSEMKDAYEQNLSTLKTFIADFEQEDINGQAAQLADSAVWNSPAYGDSLKTKQQWLDAQKYWMDNWSNLKLTNAQFLPGIDSATHEFDGSVRYYGTWDGVPSGASGPIKFYGTYDFNKDHKIISGNDFFDVGGLLNSINSKGK